MNITSVRARRVNADRVQALFLARSVTRLHETAVVLARDGLMADWAAIVDRSGSVIASTSGEVVGRGTLLAALAWGSATDEQDTVSAALITGFDASLVAGRRGSALAPGERERLAVLAGIVGVVWGHLSQDGADRSLRSGPPSRPTAV